MLKPKRRKEIAEQVATRKGWVTVAQLAARCGCSRSTALKDLQGMVKAGILERQLAGPAAFYSLVER